MNIVKAPDKSSRLDTLKWLFAGALFLVGMGLNYHYASQPAVFRLMGWLVVLVLCGFVVSQTEKGRQLWELINGARAELRKVVWPTRPETIQTTAIVVAMVVIVALFLWVIDSGLLWAIGLLTGQRG